MVQMPDNAERITFSGADVEYEDNAFLLGDLKAGEGYPLKAGQQIVSTT
jgi:hypothetical protein